MRGPLRLKPGGKFGIERRQPCSLGAQRGQLCRKAGGFVLPRPQPLPQRNLTRSQGQPDQHAGKSGGKNSDNRKIDVKTIGGRTEWTNRGCSP